MESSHVRITCVLGLVCTFLLAIAPPGQCQNQVVVVDRIVKAKALSGTVNFAGHPAPNAIVEDCNVGWKDQIAVTQTDDRGRFQFSRGDTKRVHYFKVSWKGANPLWVKVKVAPKAKDLVLNLTPST